MTLAAILAPLGHDLSPDEAAFFRDADPWGFILFARNLESRAQILRLTDKLRATLGRDAPILIDQEGGRVQRLRPPLAREWLPPLDQVTQAGPHAERVMYLRYRLIADELRCLGIDVNCAPSGDIAHDTTHPFLRNRCYAGDAQQVAEIARSVALGLMAGGVLPVIKHMPGHGRATMDSHKDLPVVDDSVEVLSAQDFATFRALNDLPLGMTAHVRFTVFDDLPATISPRMIQVIREDIGFQGLLMTDDLSMEALPGTIRDRARAARGAGVDLILHCNGERTEMEAVTAEAGTLSPGAEAKGLSVLARRNTPEPIDIGELEAEFETLLKGGLV